ncbi:MAG TPA: hypothetical protein VEW90_04725, partial [Gaiellaceae bacterium]|nr:hypothetical protein [Gaiellaceae bacterium]
VTGGGWIMSPPGACKLASCSDSTVGKANFGFVSKYQKGAKTPTGQTEFQFKSGNLNFHSTNYEVLVISGCKAQYRGTGTINGVGVYEFTLTAYDAQFGNSGSCAGKSKDSFRIKIKNGGTVVYDNRMGSADDVDGADPQEISGGSIVIHNGK